MKTMGFHRLTAAVAATAIAAAFASFAPGLAQAQTHRRHFGVIDIAEACVLCKFAFEDGTCIGVITIGDGMTDLLFNEFHDLLQTWGDDIVVVIAEGVGGNAKG